MTTIQVPLRDVQNGDILTITASVDGFVHDVAGNAPLTSTIYISAKGLHGSLCVEPEMLAKVERPDPDAELIEVMAKAIGDRIESNWRSERFNERSPRAQRLMRDDARAALAAAREAGLL